MVTFRKQFDEKAHQAAAAASRARVVFGESIVDQAAARDLDINVIAARCGAGGDPSPARVVEVMRDLGLTAGSQPFYGDFSLGMTYHEAMTTLREKQAAFMELPASMRSAFGNDAAELLDVVRRAAGGDAKSLARLEKAGVSTPPAPAVVPAAAAAAPAPDPGASKV